jgi:hypothetical protein
LVGHGKAASVPSGERAASGVVVQYSCILWALGASRFLRAKTPVPPEHTLKATHEQTWHDMQQITRAPG